MMTRSNTVFVSGLVILLIFILLWSSCDRQTPRNRSEPIKIGQTIKGSLSTSDYDDIFADRSYADLYDIELLPGQGIKVRLESDDFDTYLSIMSGPGHNIIDNDDIEPGNTNSSLTWSPQSKGRYFIAATSLGKGETGSYTLSVTKAEPAKSEPSKAEPSKSEQ